MDYVVGSVAALISGNVTPNRPKAIRRALTPTKHQPSPNVTPKSEFVEDRSIFLSPTQQKKKAIVKKSPKRIFQNPDLDVTEDCEGNSSLSSPKAEKVKKHLKEELDADNKQSTLQKSSNKLNKSLDYVSPNKKSKTVDASQSNDTIPKKKKNKHNSESNVKSENGSEIAIKTEQVEIPNIFSDGHNKSTKKNMRKQKSGADRFDTHDRKSEVANSNESCTVKFNTKSSENNSEKVNIQVTVNKPDKKKKLKNKHKNLINKTDESKEETLENKENKHCQDVTNLDKANSSKKKKNRKRKSIQKMQKSEMEEEIRAPKTEKLEVEENKSDSESEEVKSKNIPNPNAITEQDSDSEHDSDNEIESENEEANEEILKKGNEEQDQSSDEEEEREQKSMKNNEKKSEKKRTQVTTEEEIKRTLFVGNVPFSSKCKKEIKKIFNQYGQIETIRIRTIPVKDARATPKLAVIKNELHPERTTVNVYVKYADPDSVGKAIAANNTVLNGNHLRVTRSDSTGSEHDPHCAVFVGNLPFAIEDETLRSKFEKCGEIDSVRIIRDRKTNAGKGFGYVNFTSKDGVELALALSEEDRTIKNKILRVNRCTQGQSKGQKAGGVARQGGKWNQARGQGREEGAARRLMYKRKRQEQGTGGEGPPNKIQKKITQPNKEKKPRKEFVGMTAEKKKKQKFNKGLKKKKALSEILTKTW